MKHAFLAGKTALAKTAILAHPCTDCKLAVTSDASDVSVGAALDLYKQGYWQPLTFFTRQLSKVKLKYSALDSKLLGVHLAIRHFKFMFKALQFSIYTYHKPLVHAMAKTGELWSAQQHRYLSTFSECTIDIQYISGKNNVVAD